MFIFFDPVIQFRKKYSENIALSVSLCLFPLFSSLLSSTPHLINCLTSQPVGLSCPSHPPPDSSQLKLVPGTWRWSWSLGRPWLGVLMCFQEIKAKDIIGANICFKFLRLLTTCRTLMAPGRGCLALAILLAIVDIRLGGEDSQSPDPQSRDNHQEKNPGLMRRDGSQDFSLWWGRKGPTLS